MNIKKLKSYLEILFCIGLCLGILVSFDFGCSFLPDYYSGFLAGIAACLILGGGTLKHVIKDGTDQNM